MRVLARVALGVMAAIFALAAFPRRGAAAESIASPASESLQAESLDPTASIQVFLTPAAARAKLFPEAQRFHREVKRIPGDFKRELESHLGRRFAEDSLEVFLAHDGSGNLDGYVAIGNEIGKYRPITFAVGIDTRFRVRGVAVLVYRESRGGEVRRSRFLQQYKGKEYADPIRINRDIINITGATMSVRSLNFGVKKLLGLIAYFYREPPANHRDRSRHE